ncbi:MAG TPA: LacI family DNA-binding transcriptional regulator [Phototrophicaceae bacterium]|nr:LacI family DNA-binding transcriptional regulator [Phototrophicaceae bacterium]
MPSRNDQPTLKDVALQVGVSTATVSRVLNNTAPVNVETRRRILEAISALGYEHTPTLAPAETEKHLIALLIADILNPFFTEIVRGVAEEIQLQQFGLLLYDTSASSYRSEEVFPFLIDQRVSGIIACSAPIPPADLIAFYEQQLVPVVVLNRRLDHPRIPTITIDFENAAYRATQHLIGLNHTRIGYLAEYSAAEPTQARQRGIERALREIGLTLQSDWCPAAFPSAEGGFQAMSSLLAADHNCQPTAVIAYNDMMALGALHAIRTSGRSVPDDISVVGFDGIGMAAHANPPLTTIEQPKYRMGRLAMQTLKRLIEEPNSPGGGYTLVESPLVIRESTGPANR